jgi:hypothetical protein
VVVGMRVGGVVVIWYGMIELDRIVLMWTRE